MQDELKAPAGSARDDRQELARILSLSDGVFAIALTLLVLTLDVPDLENVRVRRLDEELRTALLDEVPRIGSFVLSFFIEALYWTTHHVKFRYIQRYDRGLIWINFLFLLLISFLPFPTEVVGRYGDESTAVALYSGTLAATGFVATFLWWYATSGHRLVDSRLHTGAIRSVTLRNLVVPSVFLASAITSVISVPLAQGLWYVALPITFVLMRWHRRDRAALDASISAAPADASV